MIPVFFLILSISVFLLSACTDRPVKSENCIQRIFIILPLRQTFILTPAFSCREYTQNIIQKNSQGLPCIHSVPAKQTGSSPAFTISVIRLFRQCLPYNIDSRFSAD
jgi:hypothetical protein